ncbi:MAG: hypothetical protein WA040_21275 [Anaerolineae bacterium]
MTNHLALPKHWPRITTETIRTDHTLQFFVHLRKNWATLQPEQRERFLLQAAAQLDAWAAQLRSEAANQRSVSHPPAHLPTASTHTKSPAAARPTSCSWP